MTSLKRQYTLVDFAEDLDWKPLHFVKRLPKKRRCSVCCLVRKKAAVLPCGHVVCRCCYDHCEVEDGYACSIDGQNFPSNVKWRKFPIKNMLTRKVHCWNETHGCPAVMAVSKVSKHFHRDCQYHATLCSGCSTMVLSRNYCEHLRFCCHELREYQASKNEKQSGTVKRGILKRARKMLEDTVGNLKVLLDWSLGPDSVIYATMCNIILSMQGLNSFFEEDSRNLLQITDVTGKRLREVEAVNEGLGYVLGECTEGFARARHDIASGKEDGRTRTDFAEDVIRHVLRAAAKNVTCYGFVIEEMASLEAMALMCGYAIYKGTHTYLRGYNIVPGAVLERCGEYVYLHLVMAIDAGELDDIVPWPFSHLIKCRFVHESTGEEYALIFKPSRNSLLCQKPTGLDDGAVQFPDSVSLETLKSGGYIQDDGLRVVLELL